MADRAAHIADGEARTGGRTCSRFADRHARDARQQGSITYRVVAAEPPHRLTLAIDDAAYRAATEYRIVKEAGATDVVVTARLEAVGIAQTLRFLLWRQRLVPMLQQSARERAQAFIDLAERTGP